MWSRYGRIVAAACILWTLVGSNGWAGESPAEKAAARPAPDCGSGVVKDDGDPESGYGFVPSAKSGIYVQRFHAAEFPRRELKTVCICLLKTRGETTASFDVVFFEDAGGRPAIEAYAWVPAEARDIPTTKETAGKFFAVDVSGVVLRPGVTYIGARWDPSQAAYTFICNDQSETTTKVHDVFFWEDRMPGWARVDQSPDPIFRPHRSILVRAVAATADEATTIRPRLIQGPASATPRIRSSKKQPED